MCLFILPANNLLCKNVWRYQNSSYWGTKKIVILVWGWWSKKPVTALKMLQSWRPKPAIWFQPCLSGWEKMTAISSDLETIRCQGTGMLSVTPTLLFMTSHYSNMETDEERRDQDKAKDIVFRSAGKHQPLQMLPEDHTRESAETSPCSCATVRITFSTLFSYSIYRRRSNTLLIPCSHLG